MTDNFYSIMEEHKRFYIEKIRYSGTAVFVQYLWNGQQLYKEISSGLCFVGR